MALGGERLDVEVADLALGGAGAAPSARKEAAQREQPRRGRGGRSPVAAGERRRPRSSAWRTTASLGRAQRVPGAKEDRPDPDPAMPPTAKTAIAVQTIQRAEPTTIHLPVSALLPPERVQDSAVVRKIAVWQHAAGRSITRSAQC